MTFTLSLIRNYVSSWYLRTNFTTKFTVFYNLQLLPANVFHKRTSGWGKNWSFKVILTDMLPMMQVLSWMENWNEFQKRGLSVNLTIDKER